MRIALLLVLIAAVAAPSCACAQKVYKSTGPDGSIIYSDKPPADGKIEKTFEFANLPSTPVSPAPVEEVRPVTKAKAVPPQPVVSLQANGVLLFTTKRCPYCRQARAYLAQKGISYQDVDVETPGGRSAFAQVGGGGVPVLYAHGKRMRGFGAAAYDAFLGSR